LKQSLFAVRLGDVCRNIIPDKFPIPNIICNFAIAGHVLARHFEKIRSACRVTDRHTQQAQHLPATLLIREPASVAWTPTSFFNNIKKIKLL
jgi:hypothetical protein